MHGFDRVGADAREFPLQTPHVSADCPFGHDDVVVVGALQQLVARVDLTGKPNNAFTR